MIKPLRLLLNLLCICTLSLSYAADASSPTEKLMELWHRSSLNLYDTACGTLFQQELAQLLAAQGTIDYELPELAGLSDLLAPDRRLRLITWTHELASEETLYKGIALYRDSHDSLRILPLKDRQLPVKQGFINEQWFNFPCSLSEWIGAVYYGIQPFEFQGIKAYLLLGVAGRTPLCTRKVIETMYIDATDELQIGLPCLAYTNTRIFQRILYSYSSRVAMTLQLIEKGKKVLIDHLAPSAPQYSGLPQFYGPDGSQDAFILSKEGYWRHENDVLVTDPVEHSPTKKLIYNKGY